MSGTGLTSDVIVTWPKKARPFASYIAACHQAKRDGLVINYRIQYPPQRDRLWGAPGTKRPYPPRLYRVHDGLVRGWTEIKGVMLKDEGEVARVADDLTPGDRWPAGWYIVCDPEWHDCDLPLQSMPGFRGWRYFGSVLPVE